MVRSDNVILHTLAGCSRDSVVAVLDKYSPIDSHCEPSMLSSCVVKRWFWLYFSNLCQAVWPSIRSIHSFIVAYNLCQAFCTAFITVFLFSFVAYIFLFIVYCVFLYFIITAALSVLINGWMDSADYAVATSQDVRMSVRLSVCRAERPRDCRLSLSEYTVRQKLHSLNCCNNFVKLHWFS